MRLRIRRTPQSGSSGSELILLNLNLAFLGFFLLCHAHLCDLDHEEYGIHRHGGNHEGDRCIGCDLNQRAARSDQLDRVLEFIRKKSGKPYASQDEVLAVANEIIQAAQTAQGEENAKN